MSDAREDAGTLSPGAKLGLDLGPLLLFFAAHALWGIFAATAVLMVAVLASLALGYHLTGRVSRVALAAAGAVSVFGACTLVFHDETFIKLKPTLVYLLFAGALFGGLLAGKPLLAEVLDAAFELDAEGWRKLTVRWGLFFLGLAALNELVWRTQTTELWVRFKVFGVAPLTLAFGALQYPLLQRHATEPPET